MPLCQWSWGLAGLPSAQNNWTTPCGAGIIEFNGIVWSIQTASVIKTRRHILVIIQERVYAIRAHVECSYLCFILVPHQIYDIIYIYNYLYMWNRMKSCKLGCCRWDIQPRLFPRQTIATFTMRKPSRMWRHQWPRCRGTSLCFVYPLVNIQKAIENCHL